MLAANLQCKSWVPRKSNACFRARSQPAACRLMRAAAAAAAKGVASRPLHHLAPEGVSSAWVLPNVPQQYVQLRAALSALQQQLDKLMAGSSSDKVQGSLAAAALCAVIHKSWLTEAATTAAAQPQGCETDLGTGVGEDAWRDMATTNLSRAQRFLGKATEQAAQLLLSAANGNNSLPDIRWHALPAAVREQLLQLFQQHGWVSVLGFPVLQKQLPYERPMDVARYHSFISSNPFYISYWEEDYWIDSITPTPAQHPWVHLLQMQQALTDEVVINMSAHIPAFAAVLQAAADAGIVPEQLLVQAQKAAAQAHVPPSTTGMFIKHWVRQASGAVAAFAPGLVLVNNNNGAGSSLLQFAGFRVSLRTSQRGGGGKSFADSFLEDTCDGSGGSCYGALTAVGSGDEGGRSGLAMSVVPVNDVQQQAELPAGGTADGPLEAEQLKDLSASGANLTPRQLVVQTKQHTHKAADSYHHRAQPDLWAAASALQVPSEGFSSINGVERQGGKGVLRAGGLVPAATSASSAAGGGCGRASSTDRRTGWLQRLTTAASRGLKAIRQ